MPTITGFWIRVQNGHVSDVWDYKPSDEKLATEAGWREAVEVKPHTTNREVLTTHYFNIETLPAQIVWGKRDLEVDERKSGLLEKAKSVFRNVVNAEVAKETDQYPETQYDPNTVDAARLVFEARVREINLAASHEDVDALES